MPPRQHHFANVDVDVTERQAATKGEVFAKRILNGEYDADLEVILEAAHHRKRELRDKRYRRD